MSKQLTCWPQISHMLRPARSIKNNGGPTLCDYSDFKEFLFFVRFFVHYYISLSSTNMYSICPSIEGVDPHLTQACYLPAHKATMQTMPRLHYDSRWYVLHEVSIGTSHSRRGHTLFQFISIMFETKTFFSLEYRAK